MMRTIDANAPYCNPEVRHDFAILFDVRDGNPNDPYVRALVRRIDRYTRHERSGTVAFCDGHVKWYPWDAIWKSHPHNDRKKPWLNPYIVNSEP